MLMTRMVRWWQTFSSPLSLAPACATDAAAAASPFLFASPRLLYTQTGRFSNDKSDFDEGHVIIWPGKPEGLKDTRKKWNLWLNELMLTVHRKWWRWLLRFHLPMTHCASLSRSHFAISLALTVYTNAMNALRHHYCTHVTRLMKKHTATLASSLYTF